MKQNRPVRGKLFGMRHSMLGFLLTAIGVVSTPQAQPVKVSGTVATAAREPVTDAVVALLTAKGDLPNAPALRQVQPVTTPDGKFEWPTVPPGSYKLVVAFADALKDWPAPATLQRFAQRGFPLTVTDDPGGVHLRLVVQLGPPPNREINIVGASMSTTMMVGGPGGPPPGAPPRPPGTGLAPPRSTMSGPSTISGVLTSEDGRPLAGVQVQATRRQTPTAPSTSAFLALGLPVTTDATGAYKIAGLQPGTYFVGALPWRIDYQRFEESSVRNLPAEADATGQRIAHYTTYYPGTVSTLGARAVTVGVGKTPGIDFAVKRGPVTTLTLKVGAPARGVPGLALSFLMPASVPEQFGQRNMIRSVIDSAGNATFADIQPGSYLFSYFGDEGWIREQVEVKAGVLGPVTLTPKPYVTVSGRVDLRPTRVVAGPEMLATINVSLMPSPLTSGTPFQRVPVSPDGTFSIPRVTGGPHVLTVAPGGASWVVLSGLINGQDSADRPVEISGNVTDAVLTLTDMATNVQGRVIGMTAGSVVIFSADSRFWIPGGSRRVRVVTITPGGVFSVNGLPPGTYHAAAFPVGARIVNSALEEAKGRTIPFELAIGEQKEIVVR